LFGVPGFSGSTSSLVPASALHPTCVLSSMRRRC
jgi:hypothetical protein